ncbi:putative poly-gamma-glutamate biosynthesis protein, partial [Acinetobacter seifertii]
MTYSLFEIKLLVPLDNSNFDNAVWKFAVDGDVSTLLLIDYALEQFQQKNIKANKTYVVFEQKPKQLGEQNLGLEKNES